MHDAAYKDLFSHPRMVEDLLRGFAAPEWSGALDFSTLEKLPAEYVSDDLRRRHGDLVWRLRFRETWLYLLVMLEFQSSTDPYMAVRILVYTGLLYQDLIRRGALGADGRLPPVLPVVLYNGRPRWAAPVEAADLIAPVEEALARFQPSQRYFLLDQGRHGEDDLPRRNLVSALIAFENSRSAAELPKLLAALSDWVRGPGRTSCGVRSWSGFGRCCRGGGSPGPRCRRCRIWKGEGRCWRSERRSGPSSGCGKAASRDVNKV